MRGGISQDRSELVVVRIVLKSTLCPAHLLVGADPAGLAGISGYRATLMLLSAATRKRSNPTRKSDPSSSAKSEPQPLAIMDTRSTLLLALGDGRRFSRHLFSW